MCDNTLLPSSSLQPTRSLLQPFNGVEGTPRLECSDPLKVLALEPQSHDGPGRSTPRPLGALQLGRCLRGGRQPGEGGVGQHGGLVDVRLYQLVSGLDRLAGERGGRVGHGYRRCGV